MTFWFVILIHLFAAEYVSCLFFSLTGRSKLIFMVNCCNIYLIRRLVLITAKLTLTTYVWIITYTRRIILISANLFISSMVSRKNPIFVLRTVIFTHVVIDEIDFVWWKMLVTYSVVSVLQFFQMCRPSQGCHVKEKTVSNILLF